MFTPYRRPDAPSVPAPLFDPDRPNVDELEGVKPRWRLAGAPLFDDVVAELGHPNLAGERARRALVEAAHLEALAELEPDDGDRVVEDDEDGEDAHPRAVVFPNPIDDPDEIVPVWLCELGDHARCDGYACPCCASGECPGGVVVDETPTRALRLVEAPAVVEAAACPDCGARGLEPCRPKSAPASGRPLTRWHRRRRELGAA